MRKNRNVVPSFNKSSEIQDSVPIPTYAPNQTLRPKDYVKPQSWFAFGADFERRCKEYLSKGNPDSNNGSYMDAIIQNKAREAVYELEIQYIDHLSVIDTLVEKMHKGDKIKLETKLQQAEIEQEEVQRELSRLRKVYWSGTCFGEQEEMAQDTSTCI